VADVIVAVADVIVAVAAMIVAVADVVVGVADVVVGAADVVVGAADVIIAMADSIFSARWRAEGKQIRPLAAKRDRCLTTTTDSRLRLSVPLYPFPFSPVILSP